MDGWEGGKEGGRTDGQTDMTKLIVAFHNFATAPKNVLKVSSEPTLSCVKLWFTSLTLYVIHNILEV